MFHIFFSTHNPFLSIVAIQICFLSLHIIFFQNDFGIFKYFLAKAKRFFIFVWLMYGLHLALQYLNPNSCNLRRYSYYDDTFNSNVSTIFREAILWFCRHLRIIQRSSFAVVQRLRPLLLKFSIFCVLNIFYKFFLPHFWNHRTFLLSHGNLIDCDSLI